MPVCIGAASRRNARVDQGGFLSLQVPLEKWFTYAGERSGRFQNMQNADGSAKTECGESRLDIAY
jgi:hypothetical protein